MVKSPVEEAVKQVELPLEVLEASIGSPLKIVMSQGTVFEGTLRGYDDFVNVVLDEETLVASRQVCLLVVDQ